MSRNSAPKHTRFHQTTSDASSTATAEPRKVSPPSIPPLSTWKRRLNTKQDSFGMHKFAGFGWWTRAPNGFSTVPETLESWTYLFLVSTMIQSLSLIPMALKYRSNEPAARRGFISSAITTTSLAFTGYWLSPFARGTHPPTAAALIAVLVATDAIYSLTSFGDMKTEAAKIQASSNDDGGTYDAKKYATLVSMAPVGLPMNALLLYHMLGHFDNVREYFLSVIASNGSNLDCVYYASIVTSISICVGNLAATLHHRMLISKDMENIATIGAIVVTLAFNIRAAGSF